MSAIVTYVAVGVFAAVIEGTPSIKSVANPDPFKSLVTCEEHLERVRARSALAAASADNPLVAYGVACVKVEVDTPKEL